MRLSAISTGVSLLVLLCSATGCSGSDPQRASSDKPQVVADSPIQAGMATLPAPAEQILNGVMVGEDVLVGGQPDREQLIAIAEGGYRSVINLRTEGEKGNTDPAFVESLGMDYVEIPIGGTDDLTEENARRLASTLEEVERPVVVHCGSSNRVGALFALKAYYVDGLAAEEALLIGQEAGMTRLEPVIRQKLELPPS